jgi:hypothetical protein
MIHCVIPESHNLKNYLNLNLSYICHSSDYEDFCHFGDNAMYSVENQLTVQRGMLLPPSEFKSKPRQESSMKQQAKFNEKVVLHTMVIWVVTLCNFVQVTMYWRNILPSSNLIYCNLSKLNGRLFFI